MSRIVTFTECPICGKKSAYESNSDNGAIHYSGKMCNTIVSYSEMEAALEDMYCTLKHFKASNAVSGNAVDKLIIALKEFSASEHIARAAHLKGE